MKPRSDRVRIDLEVEPDTLIVVEQWGVAYDDGKVTGWPTKEKAVRAAEHSPDDDPGYVVSRVVTVTATAWSKPNEVLTEARIDDEQDDGAPCCRAVVTSGDPNMHEPDCYHERKT